MINKSELFVFMDYCIDYIIKYKKEMLLIICIIIVSCGYFDQIIVNDNFFLGIRSNNVLL